MDLFEIPDDYKPEKPLTNEEADQITNYLKGHPLFLKELPEDISGNEHLVALQAMNEDEDPQKRAENLNQQANARLKQGPNSPYYMKDAYGKYTEAITLKPKNPNLLAKLHANRAMINLRYKNFGKVIEDCKLSLLHDPNYLKAYYRMAKAYISLNKYKECIQLLNGQNDSDLKAVLKQAQMLKQKEEQYVKKIEEKKTNVSTQIEQFFQQRKWKLGKRHEQLPSGVEIQIIDNQISIPLIVVYPQFSQFDLIAKTGEQQKLRQSIKDLFDSPLPWDSKGDYKYNSIQIYTQVEEAVLIRLPKHVVIGELASKVPIRGAIELIILTNNEFGKHYKEQFKIY